MVVHGNNADGYIALGLSANRPCPPARHSHESDEDPLRALEISQTSAETPGRLERARSYSVSGFEFQQDLLPLSTSLIDPNVAIRQGKEKTVGLINGIALIVGSQIGSGIFSSPGIVVANTGSVGASLLVWVVSGLLGWTGASSFAELGSAIPLNGGAQAYLSYAYGPLLSYLYAWTAIIALKPGSGAVISLIFSEYLNRILWQSPRDVVSPDDIPQWAIKLTAVGAIAVVTVLCIAAQKLGSRAAVFFTTLKIIALVGLFIPQEIEANPLIFMWKQLLIITLGLVQLLRGKASTAFRQPLFANTSTSPSSWSLALYSGLWAFDGWDQGNYIAGDMTHPERNIPRAIHSSMIIVTVLFVLANISYFIVLDKATVSLSNTVALDFGRALFGTFGGLIFAFMVALSCFGALNSSFFTTSRLICAAGQEGFLPAMFGRLHPTRKTPLNAALLQTAITTCFITIGGGFRSLINFAVVASWAFYFLTVLGLIILRVKEPLLERPYKTWIITPVIFCAISLYLLCMPIIAAPTQATAVLGFVLAGIPVFYLTRQNEASEYRIFSWLSRRIKRIRGYRHPDEGWEAVDTEGDEPIEMSEGRRHS